MQTEFTVDRALLDKQWVDNVRITVSDGIIVALETGTKAAARHLNGMLVPGFIDLQVNGGGGALLNNAPTVATLQTMVAAHRTFGTTAMTPTLITDQLSVMQQCADAISQAIASDMRGVVGVHFEGPLLAKAKKGVHPARYIRSVSDAELALYTRNDLGKVIITLAPDNVSDDVIRDLTGQGVIVCLGHSNASYEQVLSALEAGAIGFTHLFNAMSPLQSRAPGMVGAALMAKQAYCGLIVDHHHVHPANGQFAIQCKTPDKVFLVTDAMAHVGSGQTSLPYFDTVITRENNKLTTPEGTLAGSCLDMMQAVINTHNDLNVPLAEAIAMASATPANLLGMANQMGAIAEGHRADFVLMDPSFTIQSVFVAGKCAGAGENL